MNKRLALLSLLLCTTVQARTLTPHDLVMLDRISDPHLSPDGKTIAYDVRSTDFADNKGTHAIWMVCTSCRSGGEWRLAASEGGAINPRWSPDGRFIFFLSSRSGHAQIWRTDVSSSHAGSPPVQVTHLPLDIGTFRLAPNGKTIVVSLSTFPDCDTVDCTRKRMDAQAAQKATGKLYTKLFIRHWDEWADGTRNQLFALSLDSSGNITGDPKPLMHGIEGDTPSKPFGDDADYAISPDSATVIFSARQPGRIEPLGTNFDLFEAPIDGSAKATDITANPSPEKILSGIPRTRVSNQYVDGTHQFFCGVWSSTSGKWRIRYTEHELCVLFEGRVRLESIQGDKHEFKAGDAFVVPAGFEGTWEVVEPCKKWYAVFESKE